MKLLVKDNKLVVRSGKLITTSDPTQCECCEQPTPCTNESCPNGFKDAQGNPQPSPLVGPTRNAQGQPNTCMFTVFDMQIVDNPPSFAGEGGTDFDPRISITESYGEGRTDCASNSENVDACSGGMSFASEMLGKYPQGPTPDFGFTGVRLLFSAGASTNGFINFQARYQNWTFFDPPNFGGGQNFEERVFGTLTKTQFQAPDGGPPPILWFQASDPPESFQFNAGMTPLFLLGAGGVSQVVGAEIFWNLTLNRTVLSGFGNPLPRTTTFTGSATIRLLNLRRFDPNCPQNLAILPPPPALLSSQLLDPRVAQMLDMQARGGGCVGCGQG